MLRSRRLLAARAAIEEARAALGSEGAKGADTEDNVQIRRRLDLTLAQLQGQQAQRSSAFKG